MACFDNYIEVDGTCSDVTPTSGYTLASIGITLPFLDSIVTEEYDNGKELADAKIAFAMKQVFNRVLAHFSSKINPQTVIDGGRLGHTQDNIEIDAGSAGILKGIEVELCNLQSFVEFFLSDLSLHVTTTGNVDVLVYDLLENKLLDTIVVATVANEIVTVYPNKTYSSERRNMHLAIVYNSTGIDAIKTSVDTNKNNCCGPNLFRLNRFISGRAVSIPAADDKIDSNLDGKSYTGGMSLNFSVNCSYEAWLCRIRNTIALPVLYAAGLEIINHALFVAPNSRSNTSVTGNEKLLEKRADNLNTRFENSLDNILKKIKLPNDRFCFLCNQTTRNVVELP